MSSRSTDPAGIAAGITDLADAVTKIAVGVLTLVAALVVVLGVLNAIRARRREQVVIADIGPLELAVPDQHAPAPSLSPWLRQRVRAALSAQRHDASHIVDRVLGVDVELGRVPVDVTMNHAEAAISGAAEDALATMAQGLRAIAPQQADGLLGALSVVLPRRRGYRVHTAPLARGADRSPRLGLCVELAYLDGPPIATTTFWEPPGGADDPPGGTQERLVALIEPAAWWIALRLLTLRLVIRPARRARRRAPANVQLGMRRLFAGGLGRTAMDDFPQYAVAFGEDAIDDLGLAAEALDGYHRPWEILAGVREALGRVQRREGLDAEARRHFSRAAKEWQEAESTLAANPGGSRDGTRSQDDLERLRIRRLKCLLLTGNPAARAAVVNHLVAGPPAPTASMRTLYNTACLYATLGGEYLELAEETIGRAVLAEPQRNLRAIAEKDDDLRPIVGLAMFLDRLVGLYPDPPVPVLGADAQRLIAKARAEATEGRRD